MSGTKPGARPKRDDTRGTGDRNEYGFAPSERNLKYGGDRYGEPVQARGDGGQPVAEQDDPVMEDAADAEMALAAVGGEEPLASPYLAALVVELIYEFGATDVPPKTPYWCALGVELHYAPGATDVPRGGAPPVTAPDVPPMPTAPLAAMTWRWRSAAGCGRVRVSGRHWLPMKSSSTTSRRRRRWQMTMAESLKGWRTWRTKKR